MFKSRVFLCILGLLLCLCTTSEARVCFLASATDESGNATNCIGGGVLEDFIELDTEACPDKELCVIPRLNAASCRDGEKDYYDPADCCSNINVYEECSPELGLTCLDESCEGKTADGEDYVACTIGNCVCDASFTETCDGVGQMGVGISCGGKYRECACDKSQFFKCGANSTPSGATCTDSTGTYRAVCECPQTDGEEWVDDPDECCSVSTTTCTAQPNGKTVYKCNPDPVFSCRCGFTYSKSGCQSGCTDSDYSYFGSSSNVICSGGYVPWLNDGGICGNTCQCAVGYWDFYDTCNKADDNKCEQLGYTEASCPGDYISCPFNSAAKKCLGEVETDDEDDGCEYATQMACEAKYTKSICAQGTDGCFAPVSCRGGYYKDVNEVNCPDGKFSTINGADAYGCGYCATEFASCVEAGYAAEPIANAKQVTVYLADGTVEKNCFAATSQDGCEEAFFNSVCEENEDGEWVHAGCETTDATTCPSSLAVSATLRVNTVTDNGTKITTDMAGCAKCESKCLYIDQADCVSQNANSVCEADDEGCFVPTVCKAGAYTEVNDTNCGTDTYYDKLVNVDKNGCGRCGSKYTTCADLGYVNDTWSHVGGGKPSNVGDGHTFTFYNDKGIVFECWVLDNPCKYADQDACETGGAVCALKDGCYEIASCELGYKMTNGKCEKSTLYITQDECEADNPGYVCEKIWGETGYGEGYYYVPSSECQEHYVFVNGECVSNNTCESYGLVEECGAACGMCNPTSQSAVTLSGETVRCKACCQYAGARSCETANANSVCGLDENQCEVVQGCKEGYTLTNGKCISNGAKYNTLESCEAANQNSVCEEQAGGGYAATGCKTGYVTGWCLEGVKANADAYGCGECKALSSATCEEYGFYTSADSCSTGAEIVPDMTMTDGSVLQGCYACPANNIYQDVADCELKNQNSVCGELVTNGAAAATECKEGYAKKCSSGQMLKAADQFGCGTCCQYTTLYLCQTANPNGSCDTGADGCYYVDKCNSGYELVDNQCVVGDLQATYATLEECEIANLMRKCEPYGNGYEAGECYEGEYDDGTCKGVDSDYSDCEYDYASDPCQSDGHGLYLPTNCPRTKADCEKEYPYDICEKTTDANCWIPFGGLKYPNPADGDACKSKYWTGSYSYGALFCVSDTKELCQAAYPGFNCELSKEDWIDGYVPLGCASGYTFDSGYCIEDAANNCPEGEYTTLDVCEAHNTNTVCGPSRNAGCFTRDFCKTGYYHAGNCPNGQIAHADSLGCGYCIYATKDLCLANSSGFDCTSIATNAVSGYMPKTSCADGYTLTNGACVSNTPTCASGQVYADGACRKIETCEQYKLMACDTDLVTYADGPSGPSCTSMKVVYDATGKAIDCTCNPAARTYVSSTTCQLNNAQATCGLADNGCYEVIMCNDGYELVNGQCVTDDGCLVSDYSEFKTALSNSACTTVTLAANIDGTSDTATDALNIGAKTIDGAGHTLTMKSRKIWTRSDNAAVKDINMVWTANNGSAFEINLGFNVEFTNVNIDVTSTASENYALKLDENDGFVMNGKNSIKVRGGTTNRALYMSEMGVLTLSSGATLDIDIVGGSNSVAMYGQVNSGINVEGTVNIKASNANISNGVTMAVQNGGEINVKHTGSNVGISYNSIAIGPNSKLAIETNSTAPRITPNYINLAGELNITAPIASNEYFFNPSHVYIHSPKAKIITTSTGSRTLSETDAGVNLASLQVEADKGVTWQVKSSGFNKTWVSTGEYYGNNVKYPPSPYWCDATTGCTSATTCTYTSESNCESKNFNSVCTIVSGCYEPTSCEPDNYRSAAECKQKTGAYSCQMQTQDPYGCGEAILITFG